MAALISCLSPTTVEDNGPGGAACPSPSRRQQDRKGCVTWESRADTLWMQRRET
ncbi:MAG: hypothetical protein SPJ13_00765 [Bacteroidales bacterium]|nr:hypothetical protein [Bacteroidales bacterium]